MGAIAGLAPLDLPVTIFLYLMLLISRYEEHTAKTFVGPFKTAKVLIVKATFHIQFI